MPIQRVLIVDDDPLSREFLTEAVSSLGFETEQASSATEALEQVRKQRPDLVLTDLRMPGMDGTGLVQALQRDWPGLPSVIVTAHGTVEAAVEALRLGATDAGGDRAALVDRAGQVQTQRQAVVAVVIHGHATGGVQ